MNALCVSLQTASFSPDDYQRRLEEQKKIREKIIAMKEKKRQEEAEKRRKELEQRLAQEGKRLRLSVGLQFFTDIKHMSTAVFN